MITLTRVIADHWHAVERDLLALGFHASDLGTAKLSIWELISIVVAAPPNSAVYHYQGLPVPVQPDYTMTGPPKPTPEIEMMDDYNGIRFEAMPPDELKAKREAMAAAMRRKHGDPQ